ncbi:MAG TPA: PKD domain-containing protein, partial [Bacteroidia bacterium]|nr:PKD domain-containing protein [Bacteroidia bacterium]
NTGFCPQREDTIHVGGQPFLNAGIAVVQPVCPADVNGEIYVSNVSGRPGPYTFQWSSGGTDSTLLGIGAGVHDVYITDAAGCTDTLSVNVTSVSQLLSMFQLPDDTLYMPNPLAALNFSQYSSSWYWDFGDMVGTATDANPYYVYTVAGNYTVMLVSYDSVCTDTSYQPITVLIDVGIPEIIPPGDIQLANTPEGADLYFNAPVSPVIRVQIYAADGKLISDSQEPVNGGLVHLGMINYAEGNYIVRVIDDGKFWATKFFWKK